MRNIRKMQNRKCKKKRKKPLDPDHESLVFAGKEQDILPPTENLSRIEGNREEIVVHA